MSSFYSPTRSARDGCRAARLARASGGWVEQSCADQRVPLKLSDPLALAKIADILGEAREAREAARKGGRAA